MKNVTQVVVEMVTGALLFFFVIFFVLSMTAKKVHPDTNRYNTFWFGCVETYTHFVTKSGDFKSKEIASEWCVERYKKVIKQ